MDGVNFTSWFKRDFIAHCAKIVGSKVLFLDGHNLHITLEIINLALENKIELICLPPHTSSFLQPLDVGVFQTVKANWRDL